MKNTRTFIQKAQGLLLAALFSLLPYTSQNLIAQQKQTKDTAAQQTYGSPLAPEITFDKSLLEPDGTFTDQSLPKFLAKAYNEKKLPNDDFSKEACIKAKKRELKSIEGSFNVIQLFDVTTTCRSGPASMYIIKEAKSGIEETTNLKAIEQYPGMKELIAPKVPPKGFPSVALPIAYFSYPAGYGLHYIAAMPTAKGNVLCKLVAAFRDGQTPQNAERIKRAYKILGIELANFHKRFVHGDFHCFNVFYDEIGGHFTLIDNETVKKATNLMSTADDTLKLFLGLFSTSEPDARKDIIKGIDLKKWHELAFKSFIEGYISTYAPVEQKKVLQDLRKMFNSDEKYPWLHIDAAKLQELRTKYINPVFDEIQKGLK